VGSLASIGVDLASDSEYFELWSSRDQLRWFVDDLSSCWTRSNKFFCVGTCGGDSSGGAPQRQFHLC